MAKVFGAAGQHAGKQSVAAFKQMFSTLLILGIVVAFCMGVMMTFFLTTHRSLGWLFLPAVTAVLLWRIAHYANRRVEKHETKRLNWRKGALGEYEVGAELERLSNEFFIFHDVNTKKGNFDHVVVGPTGLFAIETKNWNGLIEADATGELKRNGKAVSSGHVGKFLRRTMMLRDQLVSLTQSSGLYVRSAMVFPNAHVAAKFGDTGHVHCMGLNRLRDYIDNAEFSQKFSRDNIDVLVRALNGIAGMDHTFAFASSIRQAAISNPA